MKRTNHGLNKPVVMISMDAAEPSLIEKWTSDGTLPVLSEIRNKGAYSRLKSTAYHLAGSVWPSYYTGTFPFINNIYNYIQWNYKEMKLMKPGPDWIPVRPFWRDMSDRDINILVIDTPFTYETEPVNGLEITGLTTIERTTNPSYFPTSLKNHIVSKFGKPMSIIEPLGLTNFSELKKLRNNLIKIVKYVEQISIELIHKNKADLIIINFQSTHTAGHKFWNSSHLTDELTHDQLDDFNNSLKMVYRSCDESIGNILEIIGEYSQLFLYSLHGMGVNTSRSDILPDLLAQILGSKKQVNYGNTISKIRKLIPLEIRNKVKSRLPRSMQDYLTQYWRNQELDWNSSKTINIVMDLQALIRLNLRGREVKGIVSEDEYDPLCRQIVDGLKDYKDTNTGQSIVADVFSLKEYLDCIPYESHIPDLIINWVGTPNATHKELRSEKYGTVSWPTPGYSPDGRSGNHMPEGFLIFHTDELNKGLKIKDPHILDLAPTIYKLFNMEIPEVMTGSPIF